MTKEICKIARNVLRLASSEPLQRYRRRRRRRFLENNCCVQGRRWEQIIVKHIAHAAKRSSLRSAVIHFVSSKRLLTGLNCYSREGSARRKKHERCGRDVGEL